VEAGRIEVSAVRFTSPWFWLVDGGKVWAHMQGDELELSQIEEPGLTSDNTKAVIIINPATALPPTATDYPRVRALTNKALKHLNVGGAPEGSHTVSRGAA
jgi:hypothetical protein